MTSGSSKRILCIIPARAGSKGLRHKNIRKLQGVPLLARSVGLARHSARAQDHWTVVCSTDSRRYRDIALQAGADRVVMRSKALAADDARWVDTIAHTLAVVCNSERRADSGVLSSPFDALVVLSPTTPLTTARDVRRAVQRYFRGDGSPVVSVRPVQSHRSWRFGLQHDRLQGELRRVERRQEGQPLFELNGAIYVSSTDWLHHYPQFAIPARTYALPMPKQRSVDIEDMWDLMWCHVYLRQRNGREHRPTHSAKPPPHGAEKN